ncbi:hypothetical protein ALISP_4479 [Alicycliphilus sp. B1]|nr:hypothetical protein ALISP_1027 [Alicycliphilus sp. B1]GAO24659.1 hypothetical protein ALISP_4479 [Alicycliphilus sp. B1]
MMGLEKSSSFMPVARHRERAPAMLRPAVEVLERYAGIVVAGEDGLMGNLWPVRLGAGARRGTGLLSPAMGKTV